MAGASIRCAGPGAARRTQASASGPLPTVQRGPGGSPLGCGYGLSRSVDGIRSGYSFDETCQRTVPEAITCALESTSFEDAVRNAVSLGGDADTLAAIAGAIAEAMHGIPARLVATARVRARLLSQAPDLVDAMRSLYSQGATAGGGGTEIA